MSLRKYDTPDTRNVRQEKALFEFVSDICKYEHNAVYYLGASVLWSIFGKSGAIPRDKQEKYAPLFKEDDQLTFTESALENLCDMLTERLKEIKTANETPKDEPLIRVWDKGSLKYTEIPESQFNPMFHKRA